MKRFAIGFANFFDNELTVEVVEAPDLFTALKNDPRLKQQLLGINNVNTLLEVAYEDLDEDKVIEDELEAIKQFFFDQDCLVGWLELN